MGDQQLLFGRGINSGQSLPYQSHSETSRSAAVRAKSAATTDRARVLAYIRDRGQHGATDLEIQATLRMNGDTERPRRVELENAGLVRDTGRRRETASGRLATVWVGVTS